MIDPEQRTLLLAHASLAHTADGVAWITPDARIVEANEAYCRFFGYTRDEMITLSIPDIDPNYHAEVWPIHWQQLRELGSLRFETESFTKNGEVIWLEVTANWVEFDGQEYNCAFLRDVSPRHRAEQQLHLLETCVARLNDVVLITDFNLLDPTGPHIVFVNPAFERMTGYASHEVVGRSPRLLQGPKTSRIELDRIRGAVSLAQPIRAELINYHKSGREYWIEIDIVPITNTEGVTTHLAAVERDITERKLQEQRKIEFVSTVSHELRTPLTSIRGALGLINGGVFGALPDKVVDMLRLAHDNANRLSGLIDDLLNVQKLEAGMMQFDFETVALAPQLTDAVATIMPFASRLSVGVAIDGVLPGCQVRVDPGRLAQVMANLLSNACKYSHTDGTVQVRARLTGTRGVRIEVQDYGAGIAEPFRERIFQKFAQADSSDSRSKGGTGLGLAIAREIVQHMGGTIGYDSVWGQGSVFFIELPVISTAATNEAL
jgi:PAS domain S-box-containing protein